MLLSHPDIVDAAVIGVPDSKRKGDELSRAYIARRTKSGKPSEKRSRGLFRRTKHKVLQVVDGRRYFSRCHSEECIGEDLEAGIEGKCEDGDGGRKGDVVIDGKSAVGCLLSEHESSTDGI